MKTAVCDHFHSRWEGACFYSQTFAETWYSSGAYFPKTKPSF